MSTPSSTDKPPFPPIIALFVAILAVSTASIFIRFAQGEVPSLVIAAWRMLISSIILAPFAVIRNRQEIKSIDLAQAGLIFCSGFFLALHFASWITSLEYTTITSSVVLVNTVPLWVSLAAPIFLKEKTPVLIWIGLSAALAGATIVGLSQSCELVSGVVTCAGWFNIEQANSQTGNFLALAGAWTVAGYMLIGRKLRRTFSLITYTFLVYTTAAFLLLAATAAAGLPMIGYSTMNYVWFAALAVIPQLMGHSTYNWALRYLSAPYVAVGLLGEPVGSTLLAIAFLQEIPSLLEVTGCGLILAGIIVVSRAEQRPTGNSPTTSG